MENQNKEKKLPTCIEGIQKSGRFKRLRKKKTFWAGILSVGLITVIVAGLLSAIRHQKTSRRDERAVGHSIHGQHQYDCGWHGNTGGRISH